MKSLGIFFEIDTGISTSNQFRCEIESPFTNLNEISTKLAGKTYIINEVDNTTKNTYSINQIIQIKIKHNMLYFNLKYNIRCILILII